MIACTEPKVILRNDANVLVSKFGILVFKGEIYDYRKEKNTLANFYYNFDWSHYSPKRLGVGVSDVDNFGVIDPSTGEFTSLYRVVSCGHCRVCREKKTKEWQLRCLAETMYSDTVPLFVTLTFNDDHVDFSKGVQKRDIQLFLKRLRINMSRKNYLHNTGYTQLRYIAVGEYGSKSGRPHYHLIFWGFPDVKISDVLKVLEDAWSIDGNSIGFVYVRPCDQGAVSYVLKYMRKGSKAISDQSPEFWLASRGGRKSGLGGIGYRYAIDYMDYYRSNPELLTITIKDKFTGAIMSYSIPQYYKLKWYPTVSGLIPKNVRDAIKRLSSHYNYYQRMCNEYGFLNKFPDSVDILRFCSIFGDRFFCYHESVDTFYSVRKKYLVNDIEDFVRYEMSVRDAYSIVTDFLKFFDMSSFFGVLDVSDAHDCAVSDAVYMSDLGFEDICELEKKLFRNDNRRVLREVI